MTQMASSIGRSLGQGFQVANRSWAGMGVYAGGWALIFVVAVLGFILTGVPQEAFQGPGAVLPGAAVEEPAAPEATATVPGAAAQAAMAEWAGRNWPVLVLLGLFTIAASTWLYGGQMTYLTGFVRGQAATIRTYVSGASRAFGRLLLTSLVMLGAISVVGLLVVIAGFILGALPDALAGVLGGILLAAAAAGVIWLMVRAAFWFIAVVADGQGPVAGFRASLAVTKGKWLKTAGFLAALFGIAIGTLVVFNLLSRIAQVLGGPFGVALQVVVTLAQIVLLNLYFGFAFVAASIRFYEDAKAPALQA
jgi:hypothetical protein